MKKIFSFLICLTAVFNLHAQETITTITIPAETPQTRRVYAELLGYGTNFFGLNHNVSVTVDLGQFQSIFRFYLLLDENGKRLKFNSMVGAMNYMGERGWKFIQAYVVTERNDQNVYHWLMYKDITDESQIYEGLYVKHTESEPSKPKRNKSKNTKYPDYTELVKTVYGKFVFAIDTDPEATPADYFTDNALQRLKDDYDLDCPDDSCLAYYILRTGAQDSNPETEGESKIISVEAVGDDWYLVNFEDMGWPGVTLLRIVDQKIDDYERYSGE